MKNVQKLAAKIEALRAELSEARAAEKRQVAERDLQRAIRASGLLPLLSAGNITREQLEQEFRSLAERAGRLDSGPVIAEMEQP